MAARTTQNGRGEYVVLRGTVVWVGSRVAVLEADGEGVGEFVTRVVETVTGTDGVDTGVVSGL